MADKNWQAGGMNLILAQAVVCLAASIAPFRAAWALSGKFSPATYLGNADPGMVWEVLIGGIVICAFLAAIALWIHSALRWVKRSHLRKNAFISSALNHLNQGVVMTDPKQRIVFCNDRYLEIYRLVRSDGPRTMTGPELLELWREARGLDVSPAHFYADPARPEGLIRALPSGPSRLVRQLPLPHGRSI